MQMLSHHVNPRSPNLDIVRMQRKGQEYKKLVMQRFRETRKPGTISLGGGGGFSGMHEGTPFGRHSFVSWDDKALVHQTLQSFDGQSVELMNRLAFSEDQTKLSFSLARFLAAARRCGTKTSSLSRYPNGLLVLITVASATWYSVMPPHRATLWFFRTFGDTAQILREPLICCSLQEY
jgi:hypothetical protein